MLLLVCFCGAEQCLAKAILDSGTVSRRQHERRVLRRYLDGTEHRTGLAVEPGNPRSQLRGGVYRSGAAKTRSPRHGGQVNPIPGMGRLHAGLSVMLVVDHDDG